MVSKARVALRPKNPGKRRAESPALSVSSNNTIGDAYVEETKRIKREPTQAPADLSTPAPALEFDGIAWTVPPDAFENQEPAENGVSVAPDTGEAVEERIAVFAAPAELLQILSTRSTGTKKFQNRIENVVRNAFKVTPRSKDEAPGLLYIERIVESLGASDASPSRIEEVKKLLMQVWRHQMADYIGENIACSDELQVTMNAIVNALPFRPSHNGFLLHLPADTEAQKSAAGLEDDENSNDNGATAAGYQDNSHQHIFSSSKPAKLGNSGPGRVSESTAPRIPNISPHRRFKADERTHGDWEFKRAENELDAGGVPCPEVEPESPGTDTNRTKLLKERFPEPFDAFFYHLGRHRLQAGGSRRGDLNEGELFRKRAKVVFDCLDAKERHVWRQIHKQLRKGDSDASDDTAAHRILAEQDVLTKLETTFLLDRPSELSVESSIKPVLIPFIAKVDYEPSRSVMLFLNTPDMPCMNVSQARLTRACGAAFAPKPTKVESWHEHIWVATFQSRASADNAKGKAVDLNGLGIFAEHHYHKAPHVFSCDFTGIDVSEDEVARRVGQTFAGCDGKPRLEIQEVWKLYPSRVFVISLPRSQKLFRFIIPMHQNNSDRAFMACFRPVNAKAPCKFCFDTHHTGECGHSREVQLPSFR